MIAKRMSSKLCNIEHCAILVKSWLIRYLSIKFSSPAAGFTYNTTKHMQQSSLNCKGFWIHSFQKNHACGRSWRYWSLYLEEIPPCQKTLLPLFFVIWTKFLKLLEMYSGEEFLLGKNPIREKFMISWKYIYPCRQNLNLVIFNSLHIQPQL